jgi:hypothetical protein
LNLKCDEPLSNVAFNFNVRRYTKALYVETIGNPRFSVPDFSALKAGRCRLNPVDARVESAGIKRLKLRYDEPLSNFAFNFSLRRYIKAAASSPPPPGAGAKGEASVTSE